MDRDEPTGDGLLARRVLAFAVDLLVVAGAAWTAAGRVARRRGWRALATIVVAAPGGLVYHALLEGLAGRTVGKGAAGVAVASADGGPPTVRQAAVRTALRPVDWLPAGYLLGVAAIALTGRGQRLGDLAAGTVVVRAGARGGPDERAARSTGPPDRATETGRPAVDGSPQDRR